MHVVHCTTRPKSMLHSIYHAMHPGLVLAQEGTFSKGHLPALRAMVLVFWPQPYPHTAATPAYSPCPHIPAPSCWCSSPLCAVECCPPFEAHAKGTSLQALSVAFSCSSLETTFPHPTPVLFVAWLLPHSSPMAWQRPQSPSLPPLTLQR